MWKTEMNFIIMLGFMRMEKCFFLFENIVTVDIRLGAIE